MPSTFPLSRTGVPPIHTRAHLPGGVSPPCRSPLLQDGTNTASVSDILHLEKRWVKLPGASDGKVALGDAKALLGREVLAVSAVSTSILPVA